MIFVLTPITLFPINKGPPEFPGFKATSTWICLTSFPKSIRGPFRKALTTPLVIEKSKPLGCPIAFAEAPACIFGKFQNCTGGPFLLTFINARSVSSLIFIILPVNSSPL